MKIVIDAHIPFIRGVLEPFADVRYLEGKNISRSDLSDADALIVRTRTTCDAALLEGTSVRCIASATIGFDHIDTRYCDTHNIFWINAQGCNSSSVQQYVAAALLRIATEKKIRLEGKTAGIIGVGHVGTKVAALCTALGMRVLLNDPPRARREGHENFVSLETILKEADVVTLHVPLYRDGEDRTLHFVDERFLSWFGPGRMLINSSRGEVVNSAFLRSILRQRLLSACVLDVWEHEPDIDTEILELATLGTPHIAGYSADGKANGTAMSVRAVSSFFGLGIDDWYPPDIPLPPATMIDLDCRETDPQRVIARAVLATYDILADDRRLRNSPGTFEQQRADYPVRREFDAYRVRLRNANERTASVLGTLGFTVTTL
jgi:erythronate-4-phosphate dehydrogenase